MPSFHVRCRCIVTRFEADRIFRPKMTPPAIWTIGLGFEVRECVETLDVCRDARWNEAARSRALDHEFQHCSSSRCRTRKATNVVVNNWLTTKPAASLGRWTKP